MVCKCPNGYARIHLEKCKWFQDFLIQYVDEEHEDECIRNLAGGKEVEVCCCSVELSHDESMKIKLIYANDNEKYGDEVVFNNLMPGPVVQKNKHYYKNVNYRSLYVVGRNKFIHTMINAFFSENRRVIYLVGEKGSGKSDICKYFTNYTQERHMFTSWIYEKIEDYATLRTLKSKVTGFHNFNDLDEKLRNEEGLVVLDGMDALLKKDWNQYQLTMQEYVEQTKLRFIITITDATILANKMLRPYDRKMMVEPLSLEAAATILKAQVDEYLSMNDKNLINLQKSGLLKIKSYTPGELRMIALKIPEESNLDKLCAEIQEQMKESNQPAPVVQEEEDEAMIQELLKIIKGKSENEHGGGDQDGLFNLLCFLSCFPNGIYFSDFKNVIECRDYQMVDFPSDWLSPLLKLSIISDPRSLDSDEIAELDDKIANQKMLGASEEMIVLELIESKVLNKSKSWLEIRYERIGKSDQLLFIVDSNIRNGIDSMECTDLTVYRCLLNSIHFHQLMLNSIIFAAKRNFLCYEEITECSAVNNSIVWLPNEEDQRISTLIEAEPTLNNIKGVLKHNTTNYRVLISEKGNLSIKGGLEFVNSHGTKEDQQQYVDNIEDFMVKVLTVNKICDERSEYELYANYIQSLLGSEEVRRQLRRVNFKVELFLAEVRYVQMKRATMNLTPDNKKKLKDQIVALEELINELDKDENL